jgi:hypothetical protein
MNAHAPAVAAIGHNMPPLTPYESVKVHIEDLTMEARNWADGAKVETQAQADEISRLIEDLRLAMQAADKARITENEPFDAGKAEVQERYNLLIADNKTKKGVAVLAIESLKATLKPFLDAEKAKKDAEAAEARRIAQAAQEAATAAARAAQGDNLQAREEAEALVEAARLANKAATAAENDKAQAKGGSRAMGLRTVYRAEITDPKAALIHYAANQREALLSFLLTLAQTDVNAGKRQIPGVTVHTETRL